MGIKYVFNPTTGNLDATSVETPAGSNTQIQFNDAGSFGGDVDLTWNKTTNVMTVAGDLTLDDGVAGPATTLQTITPTQNNTISLPNATGTVALVAGSSGQPVYNNAGAYAGLSTATIGATGNISLSLNGAASTPPVSFTGTWFTGGTGTTTKPQLLIEPTGTTSTAWSTSGTGLGVNAASGFTGRLIDLQLNGTSVFHQTAGGVLKFGCGSFEPYANGFIVTTNAAANAYSGYWGSDRLQVAPNVNIAWGSSNGYDGPSLVLARDAANILAQRNGTNAQTTRIYDTYTSATDYHRIAIATARATLTGVSGASVTATGLIPAGAVVMGVTSKVTTALGTGNGTTGYQIGTGADADRWGAITGTAAGTTSDNRDWTAGTIECFPSATDVIVTATGGNFDGTGVIYLSVQYMTGQAD